MSHLSLEEVELILSKPLPKNIHAVDRLKRALIGSCLSLGSPGSELNEKIMEKFDMNEDEYFIMKLEVAKKLLEEIQIEITESVKKISQTLDEH
jgi:predicted metal-binding transcription factor (methanogenesis marker protein 9)